jgi:hypothetical protein
MFLDQVRMADNVNGYLLHLQMLHLSRAQKMKISDRTIATRKAEPLLNPAFYLTLKATRNYQTTQITKLISIVPLSTSNTPHIVVAGLIIVVHVAIAHIYVPC